MRILQIDIETYSSVDLASCGVYKYVEDEDFEILLFGYAYDDEPVKVIDLTDSITLPSSILEDLTSPEVIKTAYNANFERTCISKFFEIECPPKQWRCTMVWSYSLALIPGLDRVSKLLKLSEGKDSAGKSLIKYFSVPCKPTKVNGMRTRNLPSHDEEKWKRFIEYCRQDVVVEREIRKKLQNFPMPDSEWEMWALDQKINDRGVRIDEDLIDEAIRIKEEYRKRLKSQLKQLTGVENPNSVAQLKNWLESEGLTLENGLGKDEIPILKELAPSLEVKKVLELRQKLGKSSVDKYEAMKRSLTKDKRNRGVFQFYGASRTGRWAGRIFQPQNLPQNVVPDIALAREILKSGDAEYLEMMFGTPSFILSQLIRTAIIPSPGNRLIVADFSAIEARVIAWVADEHWVIDVFKSHGKIYEATASAMFNVPIDTIRKGHANYKYRAQGKVAQLACGYQGHVSAITAMDRKGEIPEEMKSVLVDKWRKANPNIVQLWWDAEKAAKRAIIEKRTVKLKHGISYSFKNGILFANLPSGRRLAYPKAQIKTDPKFGRDSIYFLSPGSIKMEMKNTYGGKLVENLIQAIARDCLSHTMKRLDQEGFNLVMHVHDEVICDQPEGSKSLEEALTIMAEEIPWAKGLPLKGAGFECSFYQKD